MRLRGFTLVELLVAIFITAVLFAMGYGALNQALKNRDGLQERQDRLVALQRTMRLLVQDLAQAAPRAVRDGQGSGYEAAFIGNPGDGTLVLLTRNGWANPAGVQRAGMQRVRWIYSQGRLRRETRPELDAVAAAPVRGREVLGQLRAVRMRFMDVSRGWRDTWPPPPVSGAPTPTDRIPRPLAVEITLDLEDWGTVTRIVEVAN